MIVASSATIASASLGGLAPHDQQRDGRVLALINWYPRYAATEPGIPSGDRDAGTNWFRPDELAVRPFRPAVTFDMWMIYPTFRPPTQMTKAFTDFLRQEVEQFR